MSATTRFAGSIRLLLLSTGHTRECSNTVEFSLYSSHLVFRRRKNRPRANWDALPGEETESPAGQQKRFNMKIQGIFFVFLLR